MDVPAPTAGTVTAVKVSVGDTVSVGTPMWTCPPGSRHTARNRSRQPSPRRGWGGCGGGRSGAVHRPEGRRARRGAGAGCRARRLHGRVPGGGPGPQGRHGGLPGSAGRGVPQRGVYPVQGVAARGEGDRRDQGDERARAVVRRADDRPGRAALLEGRRRQPADRRPDRPGQAAQGHHRRRHRHVHLPEHASVAAPDGSHVDGVVRRGDHRRRLGAGGAAVRPARRPAGDRLHRRAGPGRHPRDGCWCSAAGSSAWRWPPSTPSWAPGSRWSS